MHEDGDDEPGFQKHEYDDQRPPEVTLKVEVVDKIRGGAQNEQQSPDLEIDAERVLLALDVRLPHRRRLLLPRRGLILCRRGMLVLLCMCHGFSYQRSKTAK